MKMMLTVLNKMAIGKMGSLIANTRPDLNSQVSDERITMACLSCLIAYIAEKQDVKASMLDSFGFALSAPSEIQEIMRPMIYTMIYDLLPSECHEELYADFVAIQFTSLGMVDNAMPADFNLKMALGGAIEGK